MVKSELRHLKTHRGSILPPVINSKSNIFTYGICIPQASKRRVALLSFANPIAIVTAACNGVKRNTSEQRKRI